MQSINTGNNVVQVRMNLADDFVHYNHHLNPEPIGMNLKYEKKGAIFEIELKYANSESDFLIKWEGPIKDWWTW